MLVIKHHWYCRKWKSQNQSRSINAHFQDGVRSISLSLFGIMASIAWNITVFNLSPLQITDEIWPTIVGTPFTLLFKMWYGTSVDHFDHQSGQYIQNVPRPTDVNILWLTVAYLNLTITVKPQMRKQRLEQMGQAKPGEIFGLTVRGPCMPR